LGEEDADFESVRDELKAQRDQSILDEAALVSLQASLVLLSDRLRFLIREVRAVSLQARAMRKESADVVHRQTSLRTAIMVTLNTLDKLDPPKKPAAS
jgi:hypothetical protein